MADRVFFLNEDAATAGGYRPCGARMPLRYRAWQRAQEAERQG